MRTCAILLALFVAPMLTAADDKPPAKEIPCKDLKIAFPAKPGGIKTPEVVTSSEQLSKSAALKGAEDDIKKQINFEKEKLVLLAWIGASDDKFLIETKTVESKPAILFRVVSGARTDQYKHTRLFVVPKDISLEFTGGN